MELLIQASLLGRKLAEVENEVVGKIYIALCHYFLDVFETDQILSRIYVKL